MLVAGFVVVEVELDLAQGTDEEQDQSRVDPGLQQADDRP